MLSNGKINMKSMKKNMALMGLCVSALMLAGCAGGETTKPSTSTNKTSTNSQTQQVSTSVAEARKYKVTINGVESEVAEGSALTKPADPTAPEGMVFFGWKNTANGGQIWDFEREDLNVVMSEVTLEPCFVKAGLEAQLFQAELCPNINAYYGEEKGMPGATYSGGQQGKGLIGRDYDGEKGATGIDADNIAFVHFMYVKGDKLTWEIESSEDATDVTLFARFSAEYGVMDPVTDERYSSVNEDSFPITVNGEKLKYGTIKFHNIPEIGQILSFQDYYISGTVTLKKGTNVIEMLVDNNDTLNGTIASSAPVIDAIKIYSTSTITWEKAELDNLERD